ncbi:Heterokaryon incompatibility protein 6, OR allele [Colletotrichum sp. SAR11_59]|nr:Heterokaryon incompatibility protein 6, OR allele [Colletotrichum sp. SAR11_59]
MPYEYHPLQGADIRLLTIEPLEDGEDFSAPICCTVEHVDLEALARGSGFKGQNHVWPETESTRDVAAIFKDPEDAKALVQVGDATKSTEEQSPDWKGNDNDLPWRHDWGDFLALSYVWGPPTPIQYIFLNGHQFPVGPNLFQALLHLRPNERIRQGFTLWIDAICINQEDIAERSAQVGRMRDIYAAAWQVVIWLGSEADDSELGMSALSWVAARNRTPSPYYGFYRESTKIDARPLFIIWGTFKSPLKKTVYKALFSLLSRPYWQRMWILQEVAMARHDAPVVCGKSCLPWRDIHEAAAFISNDETRFGRELVGSTRPRILDSWSFEFARDRVVQERDWSSERMWNLLMDMTKVQKNQKEIAPEEDKRHPFEILQPLVLARDAKITEEKDRVYGILGIRAIADRVDITPNYKLSMETIYRDFTAQLLSKGNLEILRFVSKDGGRIRAQWNLEDVPSALSYRKLTPVVGPVLNSFSRLDKQDLIGTTCHHELPTWAVCWTCKPAPTAQLRVQGIIFDTIGSLGSFHSAEVDDTYPQNAIPTTHSAYGGLEDTRNALWRTLLGDTTVDGGIQASEAGAWLLDPKIWNQGVAGVFTNGFGLDELMSRNKKLVLGGHTLEQLISGVVRSGWRQKLKSTERIYNPTEEQREVLSWAMNDSMEDQASSKKRRHDDEDAEDAKAQGKRANVQSKDDLDRYTIGWVCALSIEQTAARAMLDEEFQDFHIRKAANDTNTYTLGSIGRHMSVIACLPKGQLGVVKASKVATSMTSTFRNIKFVLMVGIGGGVPSGPNNVRLGDVVVSTPTGEYPGVVQWDFGKTTDGKFEKTGSLNNPPTLLLTALAKMESDHELDGSKIQENLDIMFKKRPNLKDKYGRSEKLEDVLFSASYNHVNHPSNHNLTQSSGGVQGSPQGGIGCLYCDHSKATKREVGEPAVHYGLIASGSQVIKDAAYRDEINKNLDGNTLCIEMEAAGLMDDFPCLVIRGICDYADSHKNDAWQKHAAAVAAALTKELLQKVPPVEVDGQRTVVETLAQELRENMTDSQLKFVKN